MHSPYSLDYLNNVDYFVKCFFTNTSNYCITYNKENMLESNAHFFITKFDYNFFNILCVMFFIISSFTWLLFFIGNKHVNTIQKFIDYYTNNVESLDYDIFLFEYFEEFDDLINRDLSENDLKKLKNDFIKVNNRFGEIIINYDYVNQGFNYYCKQSNSYSFEYLESVSRIYVVNYDCKNVYVCDYDDEEDNDEQDEGDDNDGLEKEKTEEKEKKCVFFNRKKKNNSYNITSINGKNKEIISNKYKYKGNIEKFAKICKFHDYNIIENELNYEIITDAGFYDYKIDFFKLEKNKNNKIIDNSNNIIKNKNFFLDLLKSGSNTNIDSKEEVFENLETQSNISDFSDISSFEELNIDDKKTKKSYLSFKDFKKKL
tara:strand:- start:10030 stop:11148 length:1119 start_codon:yes stop_codon:yes gene_type:complete